MTRPTDEERLPGERAEAEAEEPFPGAHSQVHGAHTPPTRPPDESVYGSGTLPLEADGRRTADGWLIRLPVRAEHVIVTREPFVRERVVLRKRMLDEVEHVEEIVRRERLRVELEEDDEHTTDARRRR